MLFPNVVRCAPIGAFLGGMLLSGIAMGGDSPVKIPATFGEHENQLTNEIKFPDIKLSQDDIVAVHCHSRILRDGKPKEPFCLKGKGKRHKKLRKAAIEGLKTAVFSPASVDGNAVPIFASFTVFFYCGTDDCGTFGVMNVGVNSEIYGLNYLAPQDIVLEYDWFQAYTEETDIFNKPLSLSGAGPARFAREIEQSDNRHIICSGCPLTAGFRVSVTVDDNGSPTEAELVQEGWAGPKWAEIARLAILESEFIPGYVNGQPTTMTHHLFMFYN
jgi:hypothetical protein